MENHNKDRLYRIIIILLIIIILILLYLNKVGKVTDKSYKPTGNVDVFDIDIDCVCKNKDDCSKNDKGSRNNGNVTPSDNGEVIPESNGEELPVYHEEEDEEVFGVVFVDDKNGDYIYQQNLRIFTNSAFEIEDLIAPGVSNTYNFVVHNSTNANLKYNLNMYDTSEYKINMKYRLKRNNEYVIGSADKWVDVSEIDLKDLSVNAGSSDSYSLDWNWPYNGGKDKDDTIAGEKMTSKYKLNIKFNFRQA